MCIKHEHKDHQIITWWEIIGIKDKEAINCVAGVLEVKPKARDQSNNEEACLGLVVRTCLVNSVYSYSLVEVKCYPG